MEKAFNDKHGAKDRVFVPGEEVYARLAPKTKWRTASVLERKGSVVYTILLDGVVQKAHANQIRSATATQELDSEVLFEDSATATAPASARNQRKNWRAVSRAMPPVLRPRRLN